MILKSFHRTFITNRNEKMSLYLGLPKIDLSKNVMYEFWQDYVKLKYDENVNLCYMDTNSFIVPVKTENIYKDIAEDVEARFDT